MSDERLGGHEAHHCRARLQHDVAISTYPPDGGTSQAVGSGELLKFWGERILCALEQKVSGKLGFALDHASPEVRENSPSVIDGIFVKWLREAATNGSLWLKLTACRRGQKSGASGG